MMHESRIHSSTDSAPLDVVLVVVTRATAQAPVSPSASNSSGRTSQQNSSRQQLAPIQRPAKIKNYTDRSYQLECPYFMKFGTCIYGSTCKYQHPQSPASNHPPSQSLIHYPSQTYNPIQQSAWTEDYTEKNDQAECPFMKYGTCEAGSTCKYLHSPMSDLEWGESLPQKPSMELPHRPGERLCQVYLKTGTCNFKSACKFHHPSQTILNYLTMKADGPGNNQGQMDEYPQRPGEPKCLYYLKFGTCKFKSSCRFDHPSFSALCGLTKEAYGGVHHAGRVEYAEKPGEPECWSFMKFGSCNFGASCTYHHPGDRLPRAPLDVNSPNGLPLRPGRTICPNFSRFGICTIGSLCEFDHSVVSGSSVPAAGSRSGQG